MSAHSDWWLPGLVAVLPLDNPLTRSLFLCGRARSKSSLVEMAGEGLGREVSTLIHQRPSVPLQRPACTLDPAEKRHVANHAGQVP